MRSSGRSPAMASMRTLARSARRGRLTRRALRSSNVMSRRSRPGGPVTRPSASTRTSVVTPVTPTRWIGKLGKPSRNWACWGRRPVEPIPGSAISANPSSAGGQGTSSRTASCSVSAETASSPRPPRRSGRSTRCHCNRTAAPCHWEPRSSRPVSTSGTVPEGSVVARAVASDHRRGRYRHRGRPRRAAAMNRVAARRGHPPPRRERIAEAGAPQQPRTRRWPVPPIPAAAARVGDRRAERAHRRAPEPASTAAGSMMQAFPRRPTTPRPTPSPTSPAPESPRCSRRPGRRRPAVPRGGVHSAGAGCEAASAAPPHLHSDCDPIPPRYGGQAPAAVAGASTTGARPSTSVGGVPAGAGAGQRGQGDGRHRTPGYLIDRANGEEIIGGLPLVGPGVIGEWRSDGAAEVVRRPEPPVRGEPRRK
ncbi:hypothetical protein TPAU25S_02836 [Tsukamurella paurometabola]